MNVHVQVELRLKLKRVFRLSPGCANITHYILMAHISHCGILDTCLQRFRRFFLRLVLAAWAW